MESYLKTLSKKQPKGLLNILCPQHQVGPRPTAQAAHSPGLARPKAQPRPRPNSSPAQARSGHLEIWTSEIWEFRIQKNIEIQIHVTQNVGKVHLMPFQAAFLWAEKMQNMFKFPPFCLVGPCCYPPLVGLAIWYTLSASLLTSQRKGRNFL